MKNNVATFAGMAGALLLSGHTNAGLFTKDVPKDIIANRSTASLTVTVDKPVDEVMGKLRSIATQCGGDHRRDEAADGDGQLIVTWLSGDTVAYIQRLRPVQSGTEMVIYMNSNVSRQQRGWPKVIDEWFKQGTGRCIPEIMRDA